MGCDIDLTPVSATLNTAPAPQCSWFLESSNRLCIVWVWLLPCSPRSNFLASHAAFPSACPSVIPCPTSFTSKDKVHTSCLPFEMICTIDYELHEAKTEAGLWLPYSRHSINMSSKLIKEVSILERRKWYGQVFLTTASCNWIKQSHQTFMLGELNCGTSCLRAGLLYI